MWIICLKQSNCVDSALNQSISYLNHIWQAKRTIYMNNQNCEVWHAHDVFVEVFANFVISGSFFIHCTKRCRVYHHNVSKGTIRKCDQCQVLLHLPSFFFKVSSVSLNQTRIISLVFWLKVLQSLKTIVFVTIFFN